ncbi:hypothetical protein FGG78_22915 [Thioclava sp. BHET1]|nr:hypothetical protein FGG78_22915 [Thioclava sp. BHET1]
MNLDLKRNKRRGNRPVLSLQGDCEKVCAEVIKNKQQAKAILKVKNDAYFLKKWVDHHRKIFGDGGIIVLDNNSNDPEMLGFLMEISEDISVYQFSGMHNLIHNVNKYADFYEAILKSSDHFIFLDADEFLYWADADGSYLDDANLIEAIRQHSDNVIPGLWLENQLGYEDLLYFTPKENRLISGLRGGKPMISTGHPLTGFINHNCQLANGTFESCRVSNLVVAHLKNVSPSQRISTNLEKLRSYNLVTRELEPLGIYGGEFTIPEVLAVDHEKLKGGNAKGYIAEIKSLSKVGSEQLSAPPSQMGAWFRDGKMDFVTAETRSAALAFLQSPEDFIRRALLEPPS